ncbi:MAG: FitA-like ribbon-helix-helix domain-containing protein [Thermoanaerobaculia bacterium]|jgi:plasmid stability protein
MAQILVQDLSPALVARLKERAERNGRSLQDEVKAILESAAKLSMTEAGEVARQIRRSLEGRMTSDSADLLREDRER